MKKLLLLDIKNANLRSALINLALVAVVAAVDVLQAQQAAGHFDFSLVYGAVAVAVGKFVHSYTSRLVVEPPA